MALTTVKTISPIKVTGTDTTENTIYTGDIWIERIYWYDPTTNGHLVSITDANGLTIALFKCVTASIGLAQERVIKGYYNGIKIDDMDSGTIFIHTVPR